MSRAKSAKAPRPTIKLAKHPSSVKLLQVLRALHCSLKISITAPDNLAFGDQFNLQLEVGEFPKGGPWGQFNEAMGNIAPANPSGNKKVTFCT